MCLVSYIESHIVMAMDKLLLMRAKRKHHYGSCSHYSHHSNAYKLSFLASFLFTLVLPFPYHHYLSSLRALVRRSVRPLLVRSFVHSFVRSVFYCLPACLPSFPSLLQYVCLLIYFVNLQIFIKTSLTINQFDHSLIHKCF